MTVINLNSAAVQPSRSPRVEVATGPHAFADYIRHHLGYAPDAGKIAPGKWIHFPVSEKRGDSRGACMMFPDGEGGVFGRWDENSTGDWSMWQARQPATTEERATFHAMVKRAKEESERIRQQERADCRKDSAGIWGKARDVAEDHPYLAKKSVKAHGVKQWKDSLIVPVRDVAGTLHGLQFIGPDGSKKFKSGTAVAGHFHGIGDPTARTILIAEGYATGATLHEATGYPVAVTFNAGNLKPVAESIRAKMPPDAALIVCADDDHATEGNPGLTKATEAAQAVGGFLAVPAFPEGRGTKDTDFNDLARLAGPEAVTACVISASRGMNPRPSLFMSASEMLAEYVSISYLIPPFIERDTTGQLFGPSGEGKTFTALDIALSVATGGETLNGHRTQRGLVLYLAGEGHAGLRRRIKAWQVFRGINVDDLKFFHVSRQAVSFDGSGLKDVRAEAQGLTESHGKPVALIVIDTLARHIEGDENSTKDMGDFIKEVDALRSSFPGSVALIVHHTGHGEDSKNRSRGSSALRAAMDFEIRCNAGLISFTKMKDGEPPPDIEFKLLPVEIEKNQDGTPLTSCVVAYGERSDRHHSATLTHMELLAVKCLVEASARAQEQRSGLWAAMIGDWRSAFYDHRRAEDPEVKTNTVKNAFLTAARGLIKKKIVTEDGDHRILSSQAHQGEIISLMMLPEPSGVSQASFPVISDGVQQPSGVISPYKGDDDLTPAHDGNSTQQVLPTWATEKE